MQVKDLKSYLIGQFYVILSDCDEKSNPFGIYSLLFETLVHVNWLQTPILRQQFLDDNFSEVQVECSLSIDDFVEALLESLIQADYEKLSANNINKLLELAEKAAQEDLETLLNLKRLKSMFSTIS